MWQKAVKPYVESGDLVAIGVVQEQHPDRTRLYRQWRELDWPIFVDSMNTIEHVGVVPIPMALDEAGLVAYPRFNPPQLDDFMATKRNRTRVPKDHNRAPDPDIETLRNSVESDPSAVNNLALGRAYFNHPPTPDAINLAVQALEQAVATDADDGRAQFALGTALRGRYEGEFRRSTDAQRAVEHWGRALELDPNHYIRRRRLQQYGPRLDKPYNFYFWVEQARNDIRARDETPHPLTAEPMGSELSPPERVAKANATQARRNPDPQGRINRDSKRLVGVEPLVTPGRVQPGHRVRVRATFRLNDESRPLWNNEADDLTLWVDVPDGLSMAADSLAFPNPEQPETDELRHIEFEVAVNADVPEQTLEIPGYALYYVCENEGGVCYYLRSDFTVSITVDPHAPTLK